MQIVKVFDAMEQLLILGAPGSGKTTLLLELARDLLDRAARDPTHPIPVVFPLSTWAESRRPLAEWLVEELYQRYVVHRKIGQAWVEADQILPLLDGLDEVKPAHRAACVEAINAFRKAHDLPLVIWQPHGRLSSPVRAAPTLRGHRRAAPVTSAGGLVPDRDRTRRGSGPRGDGP